MTAATPPWPACVPRTQPVAIGARLVGRTRRGRLVTLTLRSRAMGTRQRVNVLLPGHYDRSGRRRYVVLYLLHGAGGTYRSWNADMLGLVGGLPVITVMPSGSRDGRDGGYSDWFGLPPGSPGLAPAWESYHLRELVPFVDAHFPTLRAAAGRAIAGVSMGGGGAAKYAAEYPGTFGWVGAFSGETDPELPVAERFQTMTCKWGDPARHPVVWRDNDATALAGNLRGVRVFIRSGDGTPGPFDAPQPPDDPAQKAIWQGRLVIEAGAKLENQAFLRALRRAGVRSVNARFFHGSHSEPYWVRDMREFVPWLRAGLRRPPPTLRSFSVLSAHAWFTAWGWTFRARRPVRAFARVAVRGRRIVATGTGRLAALSPPSYAPRSTYVLRFGGRPRRVRTDRRGRLAFVLRLAPRASVLLPSTPRGR